MRNPTWIPLITIFLLLNLRAPICEGTEAERVRVFRVIQADTFIADNGERIRTLGATSPQTTSAFVNVRSQAQEALAYTQSVLIKHSVTLQFDSHISREPEGKLLAYVFLEDGTCLNAELIRRGFARFSQDIPEFRESIKFRSLEIEARRELKGIWKDLSRTKNDSRPKVEKPPRKVWWKDDDPDNTMPTR